MRTLVRLYLVQGLTAAAGLAWYVVVVHHFGTDAAFERWVLAQALVHFALALLQPDQVWPNLLPLWHRLSANGARRKGLRRTAVRLNLRHSISPSLHLSITPSLHHTDGGHHMRHRMTTAASAVRAATTQIARSRLHQSANTPASRAPMA